MYPAACGFKEARAEEDGEGEQEAQLGYTQEGVNQTSLVPRLLVGGERKSLVSTVRACA